MSDYEYEPKSKPSQYLRLKTKGEEVRIRIVSKPYRTPQIWQENARAPMPDDQMSGLRAEDWYRFMGDPTYTINETYCWAVIDRSDGKARIFQATAGVYKNIKKYDQDPDWGNPKDYDIKITRTEEPGASYYAVVPLSNRDQLTMSELDDVKKLDITKMLPNARAVSERQVDNIDDYVEGLTKSSQEEASPPKAVVPDTVIEDIGDEPINIDDIPF